MPITERTKFQGQEATKSLNHAEGRLYHYWYSEEHTRRPRVAERDETRRFTRSRRISLPPSPRSSGSRTISA